MTVWTQHSWLELELENHLLLLLLAESCFQTTFQRGCASLGDEWDLLHDPFSFFFFIYFILLQPRSLNASACLLVAHWSILLQLWSNHSAEGADALSQPRPPPPCFGHVTRAYEDGGSFVFPEVKPPRLKPKHPALRGLRVHCSGAGLVWQFPAFGDRVSNRSVS